MAFTSVWQLTMCIVQYHQGLQNGPPKLFDINSDNTFL